MGDIDGVEFFPISHTVTVLNAKGKFYRYTVDDLSGTGEKRKLSGQTNLKFGKNMKVELQKEYRWAWVGWPYGSDSLSAQYDINSNNETFNVRLFDPVGIEFDTSAPANESWLSQDYLYVEAELSPCGNSSNITFQISGESF